MAVLPKHAFARAKLSIHVFKARGCGCCNAWADIMEMEGFAVSEEELPQPSLIKEKVARGVPLTLASCHTAVVDGYVIEGHVPARDIRKLVTERPHAVGLAVPGMPYGSPGMGPENEREAYDVLLILKDGTSRVFSSYEAANRG